MNREAKHYLVIDGYNLIQAAPELFQKMATLENRREHLLKLLISTPQIKKSRVTVVFDGKSPVGKPAKYNIQGIGVIFSGDQQEADQIIQQIIRTRASSQKLVIISSDHEIVNTARDHHAQSQTAREFWQKIRKKSISPKQRQKSALTTQSELSDREVQEWLNIFQRKQPSDDET